MKKVNVKMSIKNGAESTGGLVGWGAGIVLLAASAVSFASPLALPVTAPIMLAATVVTLATTLSVSWRRNFC